MNIRHCLLTAATRHRGIQFAFWLNVALATACSTPSIESVGTDDVTCVSREGRRVCFEDHEGYAVVEGDIIIGRVDDILSRDPSASSLEEQNRLARKHAPSSSTISGGVFTFAEGAFGSAAGNPPCDRILQKAPA